MNIVFMGTPEFAVPCLRALCESHNVTAVVTQPDKRQGRGNKIRFSPVKELAIEKNIPVLQPERVRNTADEIAGYRPDLIVVVAYGQLLPESILNLPKHGCINVHGSLLPKYRGAAPIQWAVINGEPETGVTIMQMDKGLDTGDMLLAESFQISDKDTGGDVHDRMSELSAHTLIKALELLTEGRLTPVKQNDAEAVYAPMLTKELGHINWEKNAAEVANLVRGLNPWPTAYCMYDGEPLKIWSAAVCEDTGGKTGEIIRITGDGFIVKTADKSVLITEVQAQSSKRMSAADYMRGRKITVGKILK